MFLQVRTEEPIIESNRLATNVYLHGTERGVSNFYIDIVSEIQPKRNREILKMANSEQI